MPTNEPLQLLPAEDVLGNLLKLAAAQVSSAVDHSGFGSYQERTLSMLVLMGYGQTAVNNADFKKMLRSEKALEIQQLGRKLGLLPQFKPNEIPADKLTVLVNEYIPHSALQKALDEGATPEQPELPKASVDEEM